MAIEDKYHQQHGNNKAEYFTIDTHCACKFNFYTDKSKCFSIKNCIIKTKSRKSTKWLGSIRYQFINGIIYIIVCKTSRKTAAVVSKDTNNILFNYWPIKTYKTMQSELILQTMLLSNLLLLLFSQVIQ